MYKNYKIIDSHCHIYPDKIAEKAAHKTADFYNVISENNGMLSRLIELEKAAGVDHVVVQSVATAPSQVRSINRFISQSVKENDGYIIGLGTLHPDSDDIAGDIADILSFGLKGVKLHADIQGIAVDDKRCYKIYEICEGRLPILMHAGDYRYKLSNPDNFLPVLRAFPKLKIIAAHMGGWSVWEEALEKMVGFDNLYYDTSSVSGFTGTMMYSKLLDRYDENRIMFGVDYPMFTPKREIDILLALERNGEEYRKIFSANAATLYGLT